MIVATVLGKPIPKGAEVHHINSNGRDNRHTNLILCQDVQYHRLIERRTRAYDACGHAHWRKCTFCKVWDDPDNMRYSHLKKSMHHVACHNQYQNTHKIPLTRRVPVYEPWVALGMSSSTWYRHQRKPTTRRKLRRAQQLGRAVNG